MSDTIPPYPDRIALGHSAYIRPLGGDMFMVEAECGTEIFLSKEATDNLVLYFTTGTVIEAEYI